MSTGMSFLLQQFPFYAILTPKEVADLPLIRDIRLFEKETENVDGTALPTYMRQTMLYGFDSLDAQDVIQRLLFCLRSQGFMMDGFDHLYVNFTPVYPHGTVHPTLRSRDRYFPWLRFVDVGCDVERFRSMPLSEQQRFVADRICDGLYLSADEANRQILERWIPVILEQGDQLEIPYKERKTDLYALQINLRITDDVDLIPALRVFDREGNLIYFRELRPYGRDEFLYQFSTVSIGKKTIRITPRKSYDASFYDLEPIRITL